MSAPFRLALEPKDRWLPRSPARATERHERRARLIKSGQAPLWMPDAERLKPGFARASSSWRLAASSPWAASSPAGTAMDAGRGKAEAWFCASVFLLALGCIVTVGCVLATMVSWQ